MTSVCELEAGVAPDGIDVWLVPLWAADSQVAYAESLLSREERERASGFRFDKHRRRFIVAHGVLRTLIASYMGRPARPVSFVHGLNGKPALEGAGLEFNLSHSGDCAAYAFSTHSAVGIDIEVVRPMPDGLSIAARFFSAVEAEALARIRCDDAFLVAWTRKEACLKAAGGSIGSGLDTVRVSMDPYAAVSTAEAPEGRRWALRTFRGSQTVGTVAWEGVVGEVRIREVESLTELLAGSRRPLDA